MFKVIVASLFVFISFKSVAAREIDGLSGYVYDSNGNTVSGVRL